MTDWQLWREDFAQGYVDAMASLYPPSHRLHDAYISGYLCAMKVKEALQC